MLGVVAVTVRGEDELAFEVTLEELRRLRLADEASIQGMRERVAAGQYAPEHFIRLWAPRLKAERGRSVRQSELTGRLSG